MSTAELAAGAVGRDDVKRRETGFVVALTAFATLFFSNFSNLFLSALNDSDERFTPVAVSPEVLGGLLFLLICIAAGRFRLRWTLRPEMFVSGVLLAFIAMGLMVSIFVHGDVRSLATFAAIGLLFVAGRVLARDYAVHVARATQSAALLFPVLLLAAMGAFWTAGRLQFDAGSIFKPQITGGLRSTEVALIAGVQLLYVVFCLDACRNASTRAAAWLNLAVLVAMSLWLLSFGTVLALGVVVVLRMMIGSRGPGRLLLRIIVTLAAFALLAYGVTTMDIPLVSEQLAQKLDIWEEGGDRVALTQELLIYIQSAPFTGIGLGQFAQVGVIGAYPHSNLLGIAAELGIPTAAAYLAFVMVFVWYGLVKLRRVPMSSPLRAFGILALSAFIYLHMRGLAQDTWQMKESYIWAGVLLGCIEAAARDSAKRVG
jgi:O-antigen ligase